LREADSVLRTEIAAHRFATLAMTKRKATRDKGVYKWLSLLKKNGYWCFTAGRWGVEILYCRFDILYFVEWLPASY